jgi:hypothetical protein
MSIMDMERENKIETVPIDTEFQLQEKAINLAIQCPQVTHALCPFRLLVDFRHACPSASLS